MSGDELKQIITKVAEGAEPSQKEAGPVRQLVVFELDKEEYAVSITDLTEIIRIPDVTPVPNAPDFIRGIFNLRGKIVVVVDLERRFHLVREHPAIPKHLIISDVEGTSIGVIVDQVTEVLRVPEAKIQATPDLVSTKIHADYLRGVVVLGPEEMAEEKEEKQKSKEEPKVSRSQRRARPAEPKKKSRLIILLDFPKLLRAQELFSLGEAIQEVTKVG